LRSETKQGNLHSKRYNKENVKGFEANPQKETTVMWTTKLC